MSHKKAKKGRNRARGGSSLKQHKQVKKTLLPPLMQVPSTPANWSRDKLPEMLWLDCLLEHIDFAPLGNIFHRALDLVDEFVLPGVGEAPGEIVTGLVSSFALVPAEKRAEVRRALRAAGLDEVIFPEPFRHAVSLYGECPMAWLFEDWRRDAQLDHEAGARYMKEAVLRLFASGSQRAARCCQIGMARMLKHGRIVVPVTMSDTVELLCDYSDEMPEEKQREAEAIFRAMFKALFHLSGADESGWPAYFWRHNYEISPCSHGEEHPAPAADVEFVRGAVGKLRRVLGALKGAYAQAALKAKLDLYAPDRDEVLFGLVSRQFRMFSAVVDDPRLWSPDLGLMYHRVMADNLIVLSYLIHKNDPSLFERFKRYSLGKQKLYKLHLSDYADRTGLDLSEAEEALEERISEEILEEFLPIELGSVFEGTDMRKMAAQVGLEDLYRLVYSPTSAELHGEWVSLKQHNLTLCVNPLHRFHRLPKLQSAPLLSTGVVLTAGSILADTAGAWLRAYQLESEYGAAVEAFRAGVPDAFEGSGAASAATSG